MLTVKEAAVLFRISAVTVYRLIWAGKLPALRIGQQLRIDEGALARFVEGASVVRHEAGPAASLAADQPAPGRCDRE